MIYFSDSFASSDDSVYLPGFVRFDAGVYAKINETWKAQLNIENIFNKGYWASADGNNNLSPGQPRTVKLTAIAEVLKRECDRGGLWDCDSLPLLRLTNIRVAGSHVCVFSSAWMRYF